MKLNMFISSVGRDALDATLKDTIKKAESSNDDFYIIAPETLSLFVEKRFLSLADKKAFINVQIVSFARLFNMFYDKKFTYVSAETGTMIVKKIVLENINSLVCFKKTARTQGFTEEIYATIQQLKSSNISPAEFLSMSSTKNTSLALKMKDISLIYAKYNEYLGESMLDDSGRLGALQFMIETMPNIKSAHIVLVGHENFTAQMKSVIRACVKNCKSFTAGVTYLAQNLPNGYVSDNECFEFLKSVGDDLHLPYVPVKVEPTCLKFQRHILNNLYAYPYAKMKSEGEFAVFEAKNPTEEMQYIASTIAQKVVCEGYRFRDFAVAVADSASYSALVKKTFLEYGVSVFVDEQTKLSAHPVFALVNLIFSLAKRNYDKEDVLLLARNMFFMQDMELYSNFENYVYKFGINHNDYKKPFFLGAKDRKGDERISFVGAEQVRSFIMDKTKDVVDKIKQSDTFDEFFNCVTYILKIFEIEENLNKIIAQQKDYGFVAHSMVSVQVIAKLNEFIQNANGVLGAEKTTLDEFLSVLASGIASVKISLIPVCVDSVFVGDISKVGQVKCLFVAGMQENVLPFCKDDCGIISDRDINSLSGDFNKKIEPTIKTVNRREKWKFFQGLFNTTQKLCFSYYRYGFDGREVAPSSALRDVSKLFTINDEPLSYLTIESFKGRFLGGKDAVTKKELSFWFPTKDVALKQLYEMVNAYRNNVDYDNPDVASALYFTCEKNFSQSTKEYFHNINMPIAFEKLTNAKKTFFPSGKTSVSQIEQYFSCPFAHFVTYGLRAKEREEAGLKALDVGVIIHSVCERFVKYIKKCDSFDAVNVEKVSFAMLQEILKDESFVAGINVFLQSLLKEEVARVCNNILDEQKNSQFRPIMCEAKFEKGGDLEPVSFEKTDVTLDGKIDRVDCCDNMLFVLDYKTGAKPETSLTKIYYGKQSQLFVYLQAVKNLVDKQFIGAFYMPIRNNFELLKHKDSVFSYRMDGFTLNDINVLNKLDGELNEDGKSLYFPFSCKQNKKGQIVVSTRAPKVLTVDELNFLTDYIKQIIEQAIVEITAGNITPSPVKVGGKHSCDYCKYRLLCRQNIDAITRGTSSKSISFFRKGMNDEQPKEIINGKNDGQK